MEEWLQTRESRCRRVEKRKSKRRREKRKRARPWSREKYKESGREGRAECAEVRKSERTSVEMTMRQVIVGCTSLTYAESDSMETDRNHNRATSAASDWPAGNHIGTGYRLTLSACRPWCGHIKHIVRNVLGRIELGHKAREPRHSAHPRTLHHPAACRVICPGLAMHAIIVEFLPG